jgi:hypothetical protein
MVTCRRQLSERCQAQGLPAATGTVGYVRFCPRGSRCLRRQRGHRATTAVARADPWPAPAGHLCGQAINPEKAKRSNIHCCVDHGPVSPRRKRIAPRSDCAGASAYLRFALARVRGRPAISGITPQLHKFQGPLGATRTRDTFVAVGLSKIWVVSRAGAGTRRRVPRKRA